MANPQTGYFECPRCKGQKVYESEETTGAMAMTLNTPGPVDPTIINPIKGIVTRCFDCGEIAKWHDSAETKAYKERRDDSASSVILFIFGLASLLFGFYIIGEDLEGTKGLAIGSFVASAFSFLMFIINVSYRKNL